MLTYRSRPAHPLVGDSVPTITFPAFLRIQRCIPIAIEHEEVGHRGAFFIQENGKRVAEMTYSRANSTLVIIDSTEVSAALSGQGVGRWLLDAAVDWARKTQTRIMATCPFASAQFAKDPSIRDVLA